MANNVGDQISKTLMACGTAVMRNTRRAVDSASFILKSSVQADLQRAVGSDQRMSNFGKSGGRLDVRYDIKGSTNPTSLLKATGAAWGIVEYGAERHEILPRAKAIAGRGAKRARQQRDYDRLFKARGRYAGQRPMPVAPGVYRFEVNNHPGSPAKYPFRRGMNRADDRARRELNNVILRSVTSAFNSGRDVVAAVREG